MHKERPIKSVLDVGVGFGKYGFLLRELLDIRLNRYNQDAWLTEIHGIEVYASYITPMHHYLYNHITIGNIADVKIGIYDIILAIDVIEHLREDIGVKVIRKLNRASSRALFCAFPLTLNEDANKEWKNPYERHLSLWNEEKFSTIVGPVEKLSEKVYAKIK